MDANLQSLYRATLIEQSRNPENNYVLENANRQSELKNSLCGDIVTVYLSVIGDRIEKASFQAQCCSICKASASMMTTRISDSSQRDAALLAEQLIDFLNDPQSDTFSESDSLQSLSGVKAFASRIRCATLPWEALQQALVD
ncbi:MAG TPA: SUF system NifU family Fe-S cluster assembly protein [Opitutae bacterium]|nr:SUF system NifU family Fe-S cluster assembly protein [Opitutaceae bacterium]HCR30001.1 SUF system NifU family Fe-S cluster assembly protein [Opitutae bacterium]|tara:strand:- start:1314 stop:1739 length:426 start_codon:yes stop_codon:yes gene_type:complete